DGRAGQGGVRERRRARQGGRGSDLRGVVYEPHVGQRRIRQDRAGRRQSESAGQRGGGDRAGAEVLANRTDAGEVDFDQGHGESGRGRVGVTQGLGQGN